MIAAKHDSCDIWTLDFSALVRLTDLRELTLQRCEIENVSFLTSLANLEILRMPWSTVIGDERNLWALGCLKSLRILDLRGWFIDDISWLPDLANLQELYFSVIRITDPSPIGQLNRLCKLRYGMYDEDLSFLAVMTQLEELKLTSWCPDGPHELLPDFSPLGQLVRLQRLTLTFHRLHYVFDHCFLTHLTSLRELSLRGFFIHEFSSLVLLAPRLRVLDLTRSTITDLSFLNNQLPHLEQLALELDGSMGDLSPLGSLRTLRRLTMTYNNSPNTPANFTLRTRDSNDWDLSPLGRLTRLEELELDGIKNIIGVHFLAPLTRLQKLHLPASDADDFSPLSGLRRLRVLQLRDCRLGDVGCLRDLTRLRKLELKKCQVTSVTALARLTRLETLDLKDDRIKDFSVLRGMTTARFQLDKQPHSRLWVSGTPHSPTIWEAATIPLPFGLCYG